MSIEATGLSIENSQEKIIDALKKRSLGYEVAISRTKYAQQNQERQPGKPGTWNENSGILRFVDKEGRSYVRPANERTRKEIAESGYKVDESLGVPHLNDSDVWNTKEMFNDWKYL